MAAIHSQWLNHNGTDSRHKGLAPWRVQGRALALLHPTARLHGGPGYRHVALVLRLNRLTLTDFRNYAALTWRPGARISVLYGPNGSGKTNVLEALSLLVP